MRNDGATKRDTITDQLKKHIVDLYHVCIRRSHNYLWFGKTTRVMAYETERFAELHPLTCSYATGQRERVHGQIDTHNNIPIVSRECTDI